MAGGRMKLKVYYGDESKEAITVVPDHYCVDNFILLCANQGYIPAVLEYARVKIIIPWREVKYVALVE